MSFAQCPKRLYLETYKPELAQVSSATEAIFEVGHEIGDIAIELYGGSTSAYVAYEDGLTAALQQTETLMQKEPRVPIFEATFQYESILIRADVLLPDGNGWRIVEVKASTRVKPEHELDCAIQLWVVSHLGHRVNRIALAHVDNTFVYPGEQMYEGLLVEQDMTERAEELQAEVLQFVEQAQSVLSADEPAIEVSRHCNKPYECAFIPHCWPSDTEYPTRGLAGDRNLLGQLVSEGYHDIRDVPPNRLTNNQHQRIHRITVSEQPELLDGARQFVETLAYPRFYLDFETIGPAVPIWEGTRPYETLPVQWSCHIERGPGKITHADFLDLSGGPPMRALAESMIEALEETGPILMYTSYERRVIKGLAERYPDLNMPLTALMDRLIDLAPIARENYYHPAMLGSWSIKAITPTIDPSMDYANLEGINQGMEASAGYLEAIAPETNDARRAELSEQLRRYCRFDTEAMVQLVHFFAG